MISRRFSFPHIFVFFLAGLALLPLVSFRQEPTIFFRCSAARPGPDLCEPQNRPAPFLPAAPFVGLQWISDAVSRCMFFSLYFPFFTITREGCNHKEWNFDPKFCVRFTQKMFFFFLRKTPKYERYQSVFAQKFSPGTSRPWSDGRGSALFFSRVQAMSPSHLNSTPSSCFLLVFPPLTAQGKSSETRRSRNFGGRGGGGLGQVRPPLGVSHTPPSPPRPPEGLPSPQAGRWPTGCAARVYSPSPSTGTAPRRSATMQSRPPRPRGKGDRFRCRLFQF